MISRPPGTKLQTFGASCACLFMTRTGAQLGFLSGCSLNSFVPLSFREQAARCVSATCIFSLEQNDIANAGMSFYNAGMCGRFPKNYTWQRRPDLSDQIDES